MLNSDNLTVEKILTGNSNIRNPILVSYVAKGLLPYHGLGSGIKRALHAGTRIEFTDNHDGCRFVSTVHLKAAEQLKLAGDGNNSKMHVTCEKCNTIYRLDSGLAKESGTKVRCSSCKHIFVVHPEERTRRSVSNRAEWTNKTDIANNQIGPISVDGQKGSTGTPYNSDDVDIDENCENGAVGSAIEDSDDEHTVECPEIPFVPTLDDGLDFSLHSLDQDGKDERDRYEWDEFDYEPDEFDEEISFQDFDEVGTDKDVPREDRAFQMAMQDVEKYGWNAEETKLLADVFNAHGWSFTRNSIIRELKLGMTFNEFEFAVELRKIWQSHSEFSIGYSLRGSFGDNSLKYKSVYKNPDWSFCLKIIRRFDSFPDPEEMEHHFIALYTRWKCSPVLQDQHISYYDFIRGIVDSGDAPFL